MSKLNIHRQLTCGWHVGDQGYLGPLVTCELNYRIFEEGKINK